MWLLETQLRNPRRSIFHLLHNSHASSTNSVRARFRPVNSTHSAARSSHQIPHKPSPPL
jgi:hypothetical protein